MKISAILYNWKAVDGMESGLYINNRPNRAEDKPGYDRFSVISGFNLSQLSLS